jgi:hypothetical protein
MAAISCDSSEYKALLPLVVVLLVAVVFCLPIGAFVFLYRNRDRIICKDVHLLAFCGNLYAAYHRSRYWYAVAVLLRRTVFAAVFFIPSPATRAMVFSFLNVCFLVSHIVIWPFKQRTKNMAEGVSMVLLVLISILLCNYPEPMTAGTPIHVGLLRFLTACPAQAAHLTGCYRMFHRFLHVDDCTIVHVHGVLCGGRCHSMARRT